MKYYFTICLLLLTFGIFGQKKSFNKEFSLPDKTPVFISYYGNLFGINPGIKGGIEYSLFFKEKTIEKKKKTKTVRKNLILAPSIAFYSHKNSHKGLLISADLIWRRYTKRLFISDVSFGLGSYTRINSGTTYEKTPAGIQESGGSVSYFTPSIAYSFGKRFTLKESIPTEAFIRTTANPIFNYNSSTSFEFSLELGLRLSLKYGITQKVKNK